MTKAEVIRNEIIDAAKTISEAALSKLDYLYLGEAVITLVDDFSNTYEFLYQGETYTGVSLTGEKYSVDDIVYVLFSNANDIKKMIISKKQRYSSMEMGEAVLSYNNLTDLPDIKLVATTGDYNDLINKPALKTVATSGSYNDLLDKPALKTVATTGVHSDLTGIPDQATRWPTWSEVSGKPTTFAPSSHTHSYLPLSGGNIDGAVKIIGSAANNLFQTRGIQGITTAGDANDALYLNYHSTDPVYINGTNIAYHTGNLPTTATRWPTWSEVTSKPAQATRWPQWNEVSGSTVQTIPGGGSTHTYGSVSMSGSKGAYSGIHFPAAKNATIMVRNSDGLFGVQVNGAWSFYFGANGALTVGSVPWSLVSGKPTIPATPADYIVAAGSNYRKWNNGNLECWGMGRITTTSNDQTATIKVSFGHAFVNASYSVTLGVDSGWPGYVIAGYGGRTTGGLSISAWRKDANWNDISYYANGRWK